MKAANEFHQELYYAHDGRMTIREIDAIVINSEKNSPKMRIISCSGKRFEGLFNLPIIEWEIRDLPGEVISSGSSDNPKKAMMDLVTAIGEQGLCSQALANMAGSFMPRFCGDHFRTNIEKI